MKITLPIMLAASLVATVAWAGVIPPKGTSLPAVAAALIPSYASAEKPVDLTTLYRLQLATGRFANAEATLGHLSTIYRSSEPRLVPALVPWLIYARAKAYEAGGTAASDALARAFSELYGSLPDRQIADILPCS